MRNILAINEMIDLLEDFVEEPMDRNIIVGGMAGTQIFKHVLDVVLSKNGFEQICVLEGCQDFIGMTTHSPCNNHFYYADILGEIIDVKGSFVNAFEAGFPIWNEKKLEFSHPVNMGMINGFNYLIINDIHLIPIEIVNALIQNFSGKIIGICDPYDMYGDKFIGCPTVIDSLSSVSSIVALARATYNVDSRGIDKKVKCSVTEAKIHKNSIGRIDDRQYITDDPYLADAVWNRQMTSSFRKRQKLYVTSKRLNRFRDDNNYYHSITEKAICTIDGTYLTSDKIRLRLYSSKFTFDANVSYAMDPPLDTIAVRPANILMLDEMPYHKYQTSVLILSDQITPRERYSILKNSNNVIVANQ